MPSQASLFLFKTQIFDILTWHVIQTLSESDVQAGFHLSGLLVYFYRFVFKIPIKIPRTEFIFPGGIELMWTRQVKWQE